MIEANNGSGTGKGQGEKQFFVMIACLLIFVISVGLYCKTHKYEFVFDDQHVIQHNASITSIKDNPTNLLKLFTQEFWERSHEGGLEYLQPKGQALYRPLMLTGYGIIHFLFGLKPTAFHIMNILTYGLLCITVFFLIKKLFGSTRLAFFCGILFACHPIHTESVAYVKGFGELLSALFLMLAFIYYVKSSYDEDRFRFGPYLISLVFFLAGLFTKENVITLVGLLVLYDGLQFFNKI